MKKLLIFLVLIALIVSASAQVPQKMSYQAVIRNSNKVLITNKTVSMIISILQNNTPVYVELHTAMTNDNGLVTVEIGNGIVLSGTFAGIDWSAGSHYIKTETDPTGGSDYSIVGQSELLSVPYALYAGNGSSTSGTNALLDDAAISTTKTWSSSKISEELSLKNYIPSLSTKMSGDATMDTAGVVTISNNAITSNKIMDGSIGNADLDKSNIPLSGFGIPTAAISMGGFKLTNVGAPTNNKDAANKKYVDDAMASFSPVMSLDAAQNLSIKGGNSISLADLYQSLSLAGTVLSISGPRDSHVDLAGILSGSGSGGSGGGISSVIHDATLTGNGTTSSSLGISDQGISPLKLTGISTNGTSGQVLTSNGSGSFSWTTPASGSGSGITNISTYGGLTASVGGTIATVGVNDGALFLNKIAPIGAGTILGNNTAGAAYPIAIPATTVKTMLSLTKSDVGLGNVQNVDQTNADNLTSGTIPTGRFAAATIPVASIIGNGNAATFLRGDGTWGPATGGGGGITAVSVATANGFGGTSDGNATNPTITLKTPLSGLLKGNGTAMVTAVGGTDYLRPTDNAATATSIAGGASGELLYQSATGTTTTLPKGTAGQVLTMNPAATLPIWTTPAATGLTAVAVTNNDGITATVANAVPTSTITLGLGAITPTSVSTGTVTATGLKITTGASNGYVLKSDAAGNATWQATTSSYKGMWNASTNTPNIANGVGTVGDYYIVSVAGIQLGGTVFTQGGQAIYNGTTWESISAVEMDPVVKAINGIVYSNGTTISAAVPGSFPILNQNTTGTAANIAGGNAGQMLYQSAVGVTSKLAKGTAGQVLTMDPTASFPIWTTPAASGVTAISVASANGFSGSSSGGTTPALTLSTSITGILKGNGTGMVAAVAADFPILNQSTTGNAGTATNIAGGSGGQILYQSAVGTTSKLTNGTAGQVLTSAGGTSAPTWSDVVKSVNGSGGSTGLTLTATPTTGDAILNLGGKLGIANGGTNATTAAGALTSLGAAPVNSPVLTGTPTAPTPVVTDNSTQIATTEYVTKKVPALGTAGQVLTVKSDASAAIWADPTGGGIPNPVTASYVVTQNPNVNLTFSNSGTGQTIVNGSFKTTGAVYAKVRNMTTLPTGDASWNADDYIVLLSISGGGNVVLPNPVNNSGRVLFIRNNSVEAGGSGTFAYITHIPVGNPSVLALRAQTLVSDGVHWYVISAN